MDFYVGVTDSDWYHSLAKLNPDEVNFWNPGGRTFGVIDKGAPFLFKLHSPENYIVGGGYFVRWLRLPLSLAWESFEKKNGVRNHEELSKKINARRKNNEKDPEIGCTILTNPFFIEKRHWIEVPENWTPNIVRGKTYSTQDVHGRRLWAQVEAAIAGRTNIAEAMEPTGTYTVDRRLGQGAFRAIVTENYNRRCAISGEKTLPVLEAAHIKPYSLSGPNEIDNGILLRSDMHTLFDKGYMTITPEHKILVSQRIREQFENGREYYKFDGKELEELPESEKEKPNREFLNWHNREVFQG